MEKNEPGPERELREPVRTDAISTLQSVREREHALLANYATFSDQSAGRRHPEADHPYRGPFQRDRDRIVHSAAYRRLSGKMQVFTGEMGDYHRTRLTHTYEVASIARTLGRALRLNEDLIEALALFHDIGHPPYGHAGEDALDECLRDQGGFSHNRFALTLAEELETRYPKFPGLNLTWEVLGGQSQRVSKGDLGDVRAHSTPWEVRVVDLADSITYDAHDTDDSVKLGLVRLEELLELPLVNQAAERVRHRFGRLTGKMLRNALVHELIDVQVSELLSRAGPKFQALEAANSLRNASRTHRLSTDPLTSDPLTTDPLTTDPLTSELSSDLLSPSPELAGQKQQLERFLYERVYRHETLLKVRAMAQDRLRQMFAKLQQHPDRLPPRFCDRAHRVGLERAIADYLAGMTDRFCDAEFHRLCGLG